MHFRSLKDGFFWNFRTEYEKEVKWSYIQSYNNGYFHNTEIDHLNTFPYYSVITLVFVLMFGIGYLTKTFLTKKNTSEQGIQETELKYYPYSILKGGLSTGNILVKYRYESINSET